MLVTTVSGTSCENEFVGASYVTESRLELAETIGTIRKSVVKTHWVKEKARIAVVVNDLR